MMSSVWDSPLDLSQYRNQEAELGFEDDMPSYFDDQGQLWVWDSSSKTYAAGDRGSFKDKVDRGHATGGDNDLFSPNQLEHSEQTKNPFNEGITAQIKTGSEDFLPSRQDITQQQVLEAIATLGLTIDESRERDEDHFAVVNEEGGYTWLFFHNGLFSGAETYGQNVGRTDETLAQLGQALNCDLYSEHSDEYWKLLDELHPEMRDEMAREAEHDLGDEINDPDVPDTPPEHWGHVATWNEQGAWMQCPYCGSEDIADSAFKSPIPGPHGHAAVKNCRDCGEYFDADFETGPKSLAYDGEHDAPNTWNGLRENHGPLSPLNNQALEQWPVQEPRDFPDDWSRKAKMGRVSAEFDPSYLELSYTAADPQQYGQAPPVDDPTRIEWINSYYRSQEEWADAHTVKERFQGETLNYQTISTWLKSVMQQNPGGRLTYSSWSGGGHIQDPAHFLTGPVGDWGTLAYLLNSITQDAQNLTQEEASFSRRQQQRPEQLPGEREGWPLRTAKVWIFGIYDSRGGTIAVEAPDKMAAMSKFLEVSGMDVNEGIGGFGDDRAGMQQMRQMGLLPEIEEVMDEGSSHAASQGATQAADGSFELVGHLPPDPMDLEEYGHEPTEDGWGYKDADAIVEAADQLHWVFKGSYEHEGTRWDDDAFAFLFYPWTGGSSSEEVPSHVPGDWQGSPTPVPTPTNTNPMVFAKLASPWWHFSPHENRESIQEKGLIPGRDGLVYLTNDPEPMRGAEEVFDEWHVPGELEGVVPDQTGDAQSYDAPGWHAYPGTIPPDRIRRNSVKEAARQPFVINAKDPTQYVLGNPDEDHSLLVPRHWDDWHQGQINYLNQEEFAQFGRPGESPEDLVEEHWPDDRASLSYDPLSRSIAIPEETKQRIRAEAAARRRTSKTAGFTSLGPDYDKLVHRFTGEIRQPDDYETDEPLAWTACGYGLDQSLLGNLEVTCPECLAAGKPLTVPSEWERTPALAKTAAPALLDAPTQTQLPSATDLSNWPVLDEEPNQTPSDGWFSCYHSVNDPTGYPGRSKDYVANVSWEDAKNFLIVEGPSHGGIARTTRDGVVSEIVTALNAARPEQPFYFKASRSIDAMIDRMDKFQQTRTAKLAADRPFIGSVEDLPDAGKQDYAKALLKWSQTLDDHCLTFEDWLDYKSPVGTPHDAPPSPTTDPSPQTPPNTASSSLSYSDPRAYPRGPLRTAYSQPSEINPGDYLWHAAPTTERARIQTHGLQPSDPSYSTNFGYEDGSHNPLLRGQPIGVYAEEARNSRQPPDLSGWGWSSSKPNNAWDLWRIPWSQVKSHDYDPLVPGAVVINHAVNPELHEGAEDRWADTPPHQDPDESAAYWAKQDMANAPAYALQAQPSL